MLQKSAMIAKIRTRVLRELKAEGFIRQEAFIVRDRGDIQDLINIYHFSSDGINDAEPEELFIEVELKVFSAEFLRKTRCGSIPRQMAAQLLYSVRPDLEQRERFFKIDSESGISSVSHDIAEKFSEQGLPLLAEISCADDVCKVYEARLAKQMGPWTVMRSEGFRRHEVRMYREGLNPCEHPLPPPG